MPESLSRNQSAHIAEEQRHPIYYTPHLKSLAWTFFASRCCLNDFPSVADTYSTLMNKIGYMRPMCFLTICKRLRRVTELYWHLQQGSPSSKRRGPLLQPIIEGVPALFFDDIKVTSSTWLESLNQFCNPCNPPTQFMTHTRDCDCNFQIRVPPITNCISSITLPELHECVAGWHSWTNVVLVWFGQKCRTDRIRQQRSMLLVCVMDDANALTQWICFDE